MRAEDAGVLGMQDGRLDGRVEHQLGVLEEVDVERVLAAQQHHQRVLTAAARAACDAGNLTALAESVHPLKSSAGNVGAAQVQALAESVEALARAGDAETAAAQFNELEQAFAAALAGLETERARLAAAAPGPKL